MVDEVTSKTRNASVVGGLGLAIVTTLAPTLGISIPYTLRWALLGIGVLLMLWPVGHWIFARFKKMSIEPIHLQMIGLIGVILFAGVALSGMLWQRVWRDDSAAPIVVRTETSSPPQPSSPIKLQPAIAADIPKDTAAQGARYIRLRSLLNSGKELQKALPNAMRMHQDQASGSSNISPLLADRSWRGAITSIEELNKRAYSNRPMDLATVDQAFMSIAVEGEDALKGDPERIYKYRAVYYNNMNVKRQLDSLIGEMQKEFDALENAIKSSPYGKEIME